MNDTPLPLAAASRYGERYRWLLLLSVMVGTMASIMSSTIVNVAIPGMSHHFALGPGARAVGELGLHGGDDGVDAHHALAAGALRLPAHLCRHHGAAAGRRRRRRAGQRLLAGAGWRAWPKAWPPGVVQPIPAIIILRAFEPHEQGRASGIFGMGVVLAPAIGPSIGGVLVDLFGWRSIFFMVVPFCLASIWLAYKFVPTTAPGGVTATRAGGLDWRGLLHRRWPARCACSMAWSSCAATRRSQAALLLAARGAVLRPPSCGGRSASRPLAARRSMHMALFGYRSVRDGQRGGVHLRRGAVRLDLPAAGVHAGRRCTCRPRTWAPSCCRPASCWPSPSRCVGRLADRQPTWLLVSIGLALLAVSFALMTGADAGQRAVAAGGLRHHRAHRAGLHPALAQPGLDARRWPSR